MGKKFSQYITIHLYSRDTKEEILKSSTLVGMNEENIENQKKDTKNVEEEVEDPKVGYQVSNLLRVSNNFSF